MRSHSIKQLIAGPLTVYGAEDFDERGEGVSPRRLPSWTRPQLPELMDVMARMPSGVRLCFATDAQCVGLEFLATNMVTPPNERRPIPFNLEVAGELFAASSTAGNQIILNSQVPGEFKLERGSADTVWFRDLPAGKKSCEIWLPHNAFVELRTLAVEDGATLESAGSELRAKWLHYGSSISHCMEAAEPGLIWPAVAARHAGVAMQNLGFGGQCHLDQFIARTMRDVQADVMSIKTGINVINLDSMRERVFTPALHGFLDTIRERRAQIPIILISPIFCPSAEDYPGPTIPNAQGKFVTLKGHDEIRNGCLTLVRVREIIADVVARRRGAGDENLHYLDGLSLFGAADADDLPDDLHPSAEGYVRMGERFAPMLSRVLATR